MTDLTSDDVRVMIEVLEFFLTSREEELIAANAGDVEWDRLLPYRQTLQNLYFLETTYGEQEIQWRLD